MKTASEILSELGVCMILKRGNTKTKCPKCSSSRRNKQDKSLSVLVDSEGVKFYCHHCGWAGARDYDDTKSITSKMAQGSRNKQPNGSELERLQRSASGYWRNPA